MVLSYFFPTLRKANQLLRSFTTRLTCGVTLNFLQWCHSPRARVLRAVPFSVFEEDPAVARGESRIRARLRRWQNMMARGYLVGCNTRQHSVFRSLSTVTANLKFYTQLLILQRIVMLDFLQMVAYLPALPLNSYSLLFIDRF